MNMKISVEYIAIRVFLSDSTAINNNIYLMLRIKYISTEKNYSS